MTVPSITMNNGLRIPQLGIGVWQLSADEAAASVSNALESGYRGIDTAAAYHNEEGVGRALRESEADREDVFVTSKLANPDHGYDRALHAFDGSLGRLGLEYLDLYLIHWPLPQRDLYISTWRALERLYAEGRIRAIGVSNFPQAHLERVIEEGGIVPMVNQVELHPLLIQEQMRGFHAKHSIVTQAWSPLGSGRLLDHPTISEIARERERSTAQVLLRWNVQLGNAVIPKSVTPERIRANFEIFDFELDEQEMERISDLDTGTRFGPDPETHGSD